MTVGKQDWMAERLDKGREAASTKAVRLARLAELDRMAERAVAVPFASKAETLTFLRFLAGHVLKRISRLDTAFHARSFFASLSRGDDCRALTRDLAWADAQWAEVAANDRGAE